MALKIRKKQVVILEDPGEGQGEYRTEQFIQMLRGVADKLEQLARQGYRLSAAGRCEIEVATEEKSEAAFAEPEYNPADLNRGIEILPLIPISTRTALKNADVRLIRDLVTMSERQLINLKGIGRISIDRIKDALKSHGLSLGMELPGGRS